MSLQPFSVNPYFDDYQESKKFFQILFKPGVSVQVRELNQLQSIIANQIKRFGNNIFVNGSIIVPGHITFDSNYSYVQLASLTDAQYSVINPNDSSNTGKQLILVNSLGVSATIVNATRALGNDLDTIFVKYSSSGTDFSQTFNPGDSLTLISTNTVVATVSTTPSIGTTSVTGTGSAASIDTGVIYINGYFVYFDSQTLILDKYANNSSYLIGLSVNENIITSNQDSSLLDNASGTTDFLAPGADRYQIDLTLGKKLPTDIIDGSKFVQLMEVSNGIVQSQVTQTEFNVIEDQIDQRTFETNGNFTLSPFKIDIRENLLSDETPDGIYTLSQGGDSTKLAVGLEPSTAYVDGKRIQTIATQFVNVDKARETKQINNSLISVSEGPYILVDKLFSFPSFEKTPILTFYSNEITSNGQTAGVALGTANVVGIQYLSGSIGASSFPYPVYKIYIKNIFFPGNNVENAGSIFVQNALVGSVSCTANLLLVLNVRNTVGTISTGDTLTLGGVNHKVVSYDSVKSQILVEPTTGRFTSGSVISTGSGSTTTVVNYSSVFNASNTSSIYPLDRTGISTLRSSSGVTDTAYFIRRTLIANTNGTNVSFSCGTGETFIPFSVNDYIASLDDTGEILDLSSANFILSNGETTLSFDIPAGTHVVKLSATIFKTSAEKTKSLTTTTISISPANTLSLNQFDIYQLISVVEVPVSGLQQDITSRYILDNGQRDTRYTKGSITLSSNQQSPASTSTLKITYSYFSRTGNGDYFSVDSYTNFDGTDEWYQNIPSFQNFNLRDCLDFRPDIDDTWSPGTNLINYIDYNTNIILDYQYYLGRIDKISLDGTGKFNVIRGLAADNPISPADPDDGMVLYVLNIPPYTFSPNDVQVTFIENKRYTFREIGNLERRISQLEYYASLNLLEQETANLVITDNETGLELFKNGFIVDPFNGTNIGDTQNGDYKASIDPNYKIARPSYESNNVPLIFQENFSSGYKYRNPITLGQPDTVMPENNLVTIDYNTPGYLVSPFVTGVENVNPYSLTPFVGTCILSKYSDYWKNTDKRPNIVYNQNNMFDGIINTPDQTKALSTIWNEWETEWFGTPANSIPTNSNSVTHVVNNNIVGIDYVPFPDKQLIKIQADGLKPNTALAAFLDNSNVTPWISSLVIASSTGGKNGVLIPYGSIDPTFTIPVSTDSQHPGPNAYVLNAANVIGAEAWFPEDGTGRWISPSPDGYTNPGTFTFRTTFDLTNFEAATAIVSIRVGSDNIVGIYINGVPFASQSGFTPTNFQNFIIISLQNTVAITGGINTLDFVVTNTGSGSNPCALFTNIRVTALPKGFWLTSGNNLNVPITNPLGQFSGYLYVNDKMNIKTGKKLFQLTDNLTHPTTIAGSYYTMAGILNSNQQNIVSTQESNVIANQASNPLSQIFTVQNKPGGIFLAAINTAFTTIDPVLPIIVQIRELDNGIPSSTIVPGSEVVLYPYSTAQTPLPPVNFAQTAPNITRIIFKQPIFLQNNTSYALSFITNSNRYQIYSATIGQVDIFNQNVAYKAANLGKLYKPVNTTQWLPVDDEFLFLTLYYAQFNSSATLYFSNNDIQTALSGLYQLSPLGELPFETTKNSNLLKIYFRKTSDTNLNTYSHGLTVGSTITITIPFSEYTSLYNGISSQAITPNITITSKGTQNYIVQNVGNDWITIQIPNSSASASGLSGPTDQIQVTKNFPFDILYPYIDQIIPRDCNISWSIQTTSTQSIDGQQVPYIKDLVPTGINVNQNVVMKNPKVIASTINEQNNISGITTLDKKSLVLKAVLTSNNTNVSPVIDLTRIGAIAISNTINNCSPSSVNIDGFDNKPEFIVTGTDISFDSTTNSISWSTSNFNAYLPDRYVTISGSSVTGNNKAYPNLIRIVSVDQTNKKIILDSNDITLSTHSAGDTIIIKYYTGFVSDFAASNCTNPSQYIEKAVTLDSPANSLRVYFGLLRPSSAQVDVYYRTLPESFTDKIDNIQYSKLELQPGYIDNSSNTTFNDLVYEVNNIANFTQVQVKIVFRSTDSTQVPQLQTFRVVTFTK